MTFADETDVAFMIKRDVENFIKQNISRSEVTDSRSLFEVNT